MSMPPGDPLKNHPLHKAAQSGQALEARRLIDRGSDVNEPAAPQGATPLYYTANTGSVEVARLLLENGADVNFTVPGGGQPLHSALMQKHVPLALFLIEWGADVDKATDIGVRPLHIAAFNGLTDALRKLIEKGADIQALSDKNLSALMIAILNIGAGRIEAVECVPLLLEAGIDPLVGDFPRPETFKLMAEDGLERALTTLNAWASDRKDDRTADLAKRLRDGFREHRREPTSALLGLLEEGFADDWWESKPVPVPFWDGLEIPFMYVFTPGEDMNFLSEADEAVASFLKKTRDDRLALTPELDRNFLYMFDLIWPDDKNCHPDILDKKYAPDRTVLWNEVTPPKTIYVERRPYRDEAIYLTMRMECWWEEERGVRFVFRKGTHLTRVTNDADFLTDADADDLEDHEDRLLWAALSEESDD